MPKMPTREQAAKGWFKPGVDPKRNLKGPNVGQRFPKLTTLARGDTQKVWAEILAVVQDRELPPSERLEWVKIAVVLARGPIERQHEAVKDEDPDEEPEDFSLLECPSAAPETSNVLPMPAPAAPKEES